MPSSPAVPVSSPADAIYGVPTGLGGDDLFRLGFADPPSPKGDLEKPHFAACITSENPVKQGFFTR